ncbi:HD domain-containing protein [Clostridium sp.]|uniref:HD domain-containing protein n=1 Tax=Clostridium sp. TaxID=1506 RepID=UPI003464D5A2
MNEEHKKLFNEIEEHLLKDEKPSEYFNRLSDNGKLNEYPFSMIGDLKKIPQNLKYHPEGSVFNHLMMVLDEGAKNKEFSGDKRVLMWALLLHDIGKTPTTKLRKGRWTSYDHDKVGGEMAEEFLRYFNEDENFVKEVSALVTYHMNPLFIVKNLPFSDIDGLVENTSLYELGLLSLSDRMGRGGMNSDKRRETFDSIDEFLTKVSKKKEIEKPELPKFRE